MKRICAAGACLLCLLTAAMPVSATAFLSDSYTVQEDKRIPIPEAYQYVGEIHALSDGSTLDTPRDVCLQGDFLYVADTGNNRIVKLDRQGNLHQAITLEENGGLKQPEGVFVLENGSILIADTENKRVVHTTPDGRFIEEFVKPASNLIEEDLVFTPSKVAVDNNGLLYVLCKTKLQGLFTIDAKNNFKGYVGANEVGFSLTDTIVRMFGTEAQKKKIVRRAPPAAAGFSYNDGYIYTVVNTEAGSTIKKINAIGVNLYPANPAYLQQVDSFIDITERDGILTAIDEGACTVNQFDQEGNLLCVFGSKGEKKGQFELPSAIDADGEGGLYIADAVKNTIQIFRPSAFMTAVHEACRLYNDGLYESAKTQWQTVIDMNESYALAYNGLAEALYCENDYTGAMAYFEYADDKAGYSKSFDDFRHEWFRTHFALVVALLAVISAVVIVLLYKLKKYADKHY